MHRTNLIELFKTNRLYMIACGFGTGLSTYAPGTVGSIFGLITGYLLVNLLNVYLFLIIICLGFLLGCFICDEISQELDSHDHSSIVWDEIIAMWLIMAFLPTTSIKYAIFACILFRLLDILKPPPINYIDKHIKSGFGVMLDDIVAAGLTSLFLIFIYYVL